MAGERSDVRRALSQCICGSGPRRAIRGLRRAIAGTVLGIILAIPCYLRPAVAQPTPAWAADHAAAIAEASARFAVPISLVVEVIRAESSGQVRAVSSAGALGLMQVMPATYAELRARHGLGGDQFDPRDNILAGTAYLREMLDRFGLHGAMAAYHAGPGRYAEHLATGRALPPETVAHVQRITARLAAPRQLVSPLPSRPWTHASLFVVLQSDRRIDARAWPRRANDDAPTAGELQPGSVLAARRERSLR
jgi:soluble lytic murein transglycosylase-like protein